MNISKLKALGLMSLSLMATGCIEEDETTKNFEITVSGYVQQQGDGTNKKFTPYLYVSPNYSDYLLTDVKITKESGDCGMKFERYNEYNYRLDGSHSVPSAADLNGTYYIIASAKNNNSASYTLKFNFTEADTIPQIDLKKFEYDGTYVRATMKNYSKAAAFGFMLSAYNKGSEPDRHSASVFTFYQNEVSAKDSVVTIEQALGTSSSMMDVDFAEIRVFMLNQSLIQRESEPKTLERGSNCFVEDK